MSFHVVVARYNENIDWLDDLSSNCVIYNKGERLNRRNEILIKNVGRESETYLQYIITHYDNLPDYVIFTQANISDHRSSNNTTYLLDMLEEAKIFGKSIPNIVHEKYGNQEIWWDPEWNYYNIHFMYNHDKMFGINNPQIKFYYENNVNWYLQNNYLNNKHITFRDWFMEHINVKYPEIIKIYASALFCVKKELILCHTKEYYKNLINLVNHHINPIEGHFFERSWYYIFDKD
jgi:hypothetical protein